MNLSKLIDVCVKIRPRVTVIVNLFGEVNLPKDDPKLPERASWRLPDYSFSGNPKAVWRGENYIPRSKADDD